MPDVTDGDLVIAVIQTRLRTGGCSQQDLADAVGMSKAGVRYRVHRLAAAGILDTTKAGDIQPCEPPRQAKEWQVQLVMKVLDGDVTDLVVNMPRQF